MTNPPLDIHLIFPIKGSHERPIIKHFVSVDKQLEYLGVEKNDPAVKAAFFRYAAAPFKAREKTGIELAKARLACFVKWSKEEVTSPPSPLRSA